MEPACDKDKAAAANNAGIWGRWAFIEIADPWDAKNTIGEFLHDAESETAEGGRA